MATSIAQTVHDEDFAQSVRGEDLAKAVVTLTAVGLGPDEAGAYDEAALIKYIHDRGWTHFIKGSPGSWYAEVLAEVSSDEDWYGIAGDIECVPALALALAALLRAPWPEREVAVRGERV